MANGQLLQMLLKKGFTPEMLRRGTFGARPHFGQGFQDAQKAKVLAAGGQRKAGSSSELLEGRDRRSGLMERRQQSQAQPGVARPPRAPSRPGRAPGSRALVQKGKQRKRGEL